MANLPTKSRVWELANFVSGVPTTTGDNPTFALKTYDLPPLGADQILVKTLYMSNDPAIRVWIQGGVPQEKRFVNLEIGQVMPANGLAKVIASTSDNIKEGDIIRSWFGWREYSVLAAGAGVEVVRPIPGLDEAHFLGALGITGTAAYYGLFEIAKAKKGERIVVSGAAGATGSMAVQIAKKLIGAESVIGIAGSEEKCRWVESLGADKCKSFLYLSDSLAAL